MNEDMLKQIIIDTIKEEQHLGNNLKEQCVDYIEQLQNNWNELKKYISEKINYYSLDDEDYKEFNVLDSVEQYMQELEGNNE